MAIFGNLALPYPYPPWPRLAFQRSYFTRPREIRSEPGPNLVKTTTNRHQIALESAVDMRMDY
jgi:hypothetical protein